MGVAELREAFNAVAEPRFSASKALLSVERAHDVEWSRLTFSGIAADGTAFVVKSALVRPGGDVVLAARETAQTLIAPAAPTAPAEEPPP